MTGASPPDSRQLVADAAPAHGRFPFGLSAEQEAKASRLHAESIIFDMVSMYAGGAIFDAYPAPLRAQFAATMSAIPSRSQKMVEAIFWPFEMAVQGKSDLLREWFASSGLTCGAFDIDVPAYDGGDPLACGWDERLSRYAEMPWLRHARCAEDVRAAKRDGVVALYAFYQPIVPLLRDVTALDRAHVAGLRSLMLTYNRMDHIGIGCTERFDGGLSLFGLDVVRRCNELGIIVDTSHCGHLTTIDACRHSTRPVTANHTAARALLDHPRGKADDALKAVADTGGVIGIVALPYFLSASPTADIGAMLDHIDYVAQLVGWRHVAIGSDWPMQMPDFVLDQTLGDPDYTSQAGWSGRYRRDVKQRLMGFAGCRDLPNITRGLVARGWSDEQIRGVLGENALRVFEAVCG